MAFDRLAGRAFLFLIKPLVILLGMIFPRDHELRVGREMLILKMAGGGSLIVAWPNLLALRQKYPQLKLYLLTTRAVEPFGRLIGIFDHIEVIDDESFFSLLVSSVKAWRRLFRVDTVVDLEVYSHLSTVFALLLGSRNRVAFYVESDLIKRDCATHQLFFNRFNGVFYFYDQIFGLFGVDPLPLDSLRPYLLEAVTPNAARNIEMEAETPGKVIGISHACSDLGRERMLSPDGWALVLAQRIGRHEPVLFRFFGVISDRAPAEKIAAVLTERFPNAKIDDLCGALDLSETVAVLDEVDELWCIDSALLHISRALGKKTVSIWGPTSPASRLRSISPEKDVTLYRQLPCSPCIHIVDIPPCRGDNLCIKLVSGECTDDEKPGGWPVF